MVSHPSDWEFNGYNEIQVPREQYPLIDYKQLKKPAELVDASSGQSSSWLGRRSNRKESNPGRQVDGEYSGRQRVVSRSLLIAAGDVKGYGKKMKIRPTFVTLNGQELTFLFKIFDDHMRKRGTFISLSAMHWIKAIFYAAGGGKLNV